MAGEEVIANISSNVTDAVSNATIVSDGTFFGTYFPIIKERTIALITAPAGTPEMLWIVFPLLVSVFFMTLYFGRYKKEELGWNTAFGNSLALLFVAVDLFRQIAKDPTGLDLISQGVLTSRILVPVVIGVFAAFLLLSNFFHILPKFFAFFISSGLPINMLAYVGIVVVYTGFAFDWMTVIAAFVLYVLLLILFGIIKFFEPEDWGEKQQSMIDDMHTKAENRKNKNDDF